MNTITNDYNYKSKQVSFNAAPQQILNKLETAGICPGKKAHLENLSNYFMKLGKKMKASKNLPDRFDYSLTEKSNIPEKLAKTKVRTGLLTWTSFGKMDKRLSEETFHCGGASHCRCGKGKSLKEYTADLLELIGVDEPKKIEIGK